MEHPDRLALASLKALMMMKLTAGVGICSRMQQRWNKLSTAQLGSDDLDDPNDQMEHPD